jgi:hypothetical protein
MVLPKTPSWNSRKSGVSVDRNPSLTARKAKAKGAIIAVQAVSGVVSAGIGLITTGTVNQMLRLRANSASRKESNRRIRRPPGSESTGKGITVTYNAAISPLAAAAGLDNGQLLFVPKARRLFFALLQENYAILEGACLSLAKIGPFHPDTVQFILRHRLLANSLAWAFYPTLRGSYCSMAGDLPQGRTEIDNYNGHLIQLAGDRPCPLNRTVYDLVRRMGMERIAPKISILDQLLSYV